MDLRFQRMKLNLLQIQSPQLRNLLKKKKNLKECKFRNQIRQDKEE